MEIANKAIRIKLFDFKSVQMRAFHMSWMAFFCSCFAWFGIAPLMALVREDLLLSKAQIGNTIIASVAITVLVRVLIGPLCDRFGPRKTYTSLLILGSLPVMGIGLADSYESFLLFRLAIGAIGASFVVTQYHTSMMFAPNVIGTANATTAGWGNVGGGVTQMIMPLLVAALLMLGVSESLGWRLAMVVPGVVLFGFGIAYWFCTQDAPDGSFSQLRAQQDRLSQAQDKAAGGAYRQVAGDYRVWALFIVYAACFGVELTVNNIAAIYYFDRFSLDLATAGIIAGLFGLTNLFARSLGGYCSDLFARKAGLQGRVRFLFVVLLCEGLALMLFSQMDVLVMAVLAMLLLSLFAQMSSGATFGLVPFMNRKALGGVAGIVGAGGNAGAVAAGFLFKSESLSYQQVLFYLGCAVIVCAFFALLVKFSAATLADENQRLRAALAQSGVATA